jgi:S-DNA-T family DNA segregation ATPase FtsK/SpoIIIE
MGVCGPYADPAEVPLGPGEQFLVLGNSRSGRSGLLRAIAATAIASGSRVWLIDPRHSLTAVAARGHRHASTPAGIASLVSELADAGRRPGLNPPDAPTHLLVIDDLELAEGRDGGAILTQLVDLLPLATELALSIVVARRVSGSGRAAYNAFYGRFLEFCDSGILLSGDPAEGPVFSGVRPRRQPPGRGELVVRGEMVGEIQSAWLDPAATLHRRNRAIPVKSVGNPRGWV